ncbi:MAG: aldo/keto reductase [Planctomycetota bacterium]
METRVLGKTGLEVRLLGFGGSEIGSQGTDQAVVDRLLNSALDAGLNVLDTAECYHDSEEQIARAVKHRRKDYFLFTKCGHWLPGDRRGADWTKPVLLASIDRSLKRLQTEAVDLVQLHMAPLSELEKGDCIEALEEAKKAGKTRFIGYSGDGEAAKFALASDRFDTLQTSVSVFDQEAIDTTLPMAKAKNVGVITKRTIGNAVWRYDERPKNGYHVEYWRRLQELRYDFAAGDNRNDPGPEGTAGIALRFVASLPAVAVMLVGTTKPERWRQNARLLAAGPLPEDRMQAIRARWREVAKPNWTGQG